MPILTSLVTSAGRGLSRALRTDFYDQVMPRAFQPDHDDMLDAYIAEINSWPQRQAPPEEVKQLALDLQQREALVLTPPEGSVSSGSNPLTPEQAAEICADIAFPRKRRFRWFSDWLERMRNYDKKKT